MSDFCLFVSWFSWFQKEEESRFYTIERLDKVAR